MPSDYWFICTNDTCGWHGKRYRNLRQCPNCRDKVIRTTEAPVVPKFYDPWDNQEDYYNARAERMP